MRCAVLCLAVAALACGADRVLPFEGEPRRLEDLGPGCPSDGLALAGSCYRLVRLPNLAVAHGRHRGLELGPGRVFVHGGFGAATEELGETWRARSPMRSGQRVGFASERLADGRVLVAGGVGMDLHPLMSVELYDPARDLWTSTRAGLLSPHEHGGSAPLPDGRVLLAGGGAYQPSVAAAELYDPRTETSTPTAPLSTPRGVPCVATLPSGDVLFAGGIGVEEANPTSVEIYRHQTGTWSRASPMRAGHAYATATLLEDGSVLVLGGLDPQGRPIAVAELCDPIRDAWEVLPPLAHARGQHTATRLPDGRVLVAGGQDGARSLVELELFDPATRSWLDLPIVLSVPRSLHSATRVGAGVVLVGGQQDPHVYEGDATAERFELVAP